MQKKNRDISQSLVDLKEKEKCDYNCEECWLNSGLELVLAKDEPKIAYLCDQKECVVCINPRCHHTCNIQHAVNFENLGDNHYMEKEK